MKKSKTALIILLSILVLSVFFYLVPTDSILSKIPFIKGIYSNTVVSINLKNGESNVTIDGKDYGKTPIEIQDLPKGEHTILLSKISDSSDFYKDHSFDISLAQNTEARIDIEIGPNDLLHGIVLYYTAIPKNSTGQGLLTLTSSPLEAEISLDGEMLGNTPLSGYQLNKGQYSVTISKDGYEDVDAPIIVREGYHLNVKGFLFPIPLTLEEDQIDE